MRKVITKFLNKPHLSIFILVLLFSLGLISHQIVLAWTEPTLAPPDGNVAPPLNVSDTNQAKEGWLHIAGTSDPTAELEVSGNIIASTPIASTHLTTKAYVDAADAAAGGTSSSGAGGGGPYLEWIQEPTPANSYIAKTRWGPTGDGFAYDCYYRIGDAAWAYQGDCFTDGIDMSSDTDKTLYVIALSTPEVQGYLNGVWQKIGDYGWTTDKIYDIEGNYFTYDAVSETISMNNSTDSSKWTDNTYLGSFSSADLPLCVEATSGICPGSTNCDCAPSCRKSTGIAYTNTTIPNPTRVTAQGAYPLDANLTSVSRYCLEEGYDSADYCTDTTQLTYSTDYVATWNYSNWVRTPGPNAYKCNNATCKTIVNGWNWANISPSCETIATLGTKLRLKQTGGYSNMLSYGVTAGSACGNGITETGEDCDDGNEIDGDGCNSSTANCQYVCGDNHVNSAGGETCDDGNSNNNDLCKNDCTFNANGAFIFVSKNTGDGAIGGIGQNGTIAADALCNTWAQAAGLTRNYAAWLAIGGNSVYEYTNIKDAINFNYPIYNTNGEKIGDNIDDMLDSNLDAVIRYDEDGTDISSKAVWTGTNADGTPYFSAGSPFTCKEWNTNDLQYKGETGNTNSSDSRWTVNTWATCNNSMHLYCVAVDTRCGNGLVETGETCDDGNNNWEYGTCAGDCSGTNVIAWDQYPGVCTDTTDAQMDSLCCYRTDFSNYLGKSVTGTATGDNKCWRGWVSGEPTGALGNAGSANCGRALEYGPQFVKSATEEGYFYCGN